MNHPTSSFSLLRPYFIAGAVCLPGMIVRLAGIHLDPLNQTLVSGLAILGASFLLLWACDAAQADVSQALALAVVALVAVLPEYAVDMYFTWQAGRHPESNYAHYAVANMTGANRLLVGVAWAAVALLNRLKSRGAVELESVRRTEILFLGLATVYAFAVPLKQSLSWVDSLVFLGLYAWYIGIAGQRPCAESPPEGPAECIIRLPKVKRRVITVGLFLISALVILANAEPFSEGLLATGRTFGINEFLLVQWLAPIASEAPEFVVAIMLVLRGDASAALGSLLSAKLNQWTLLVGMIPAVYGLASGSLANILPLDGFQLQEIALTAAQSLLAVVLLLGLRLGVGSALLLLGLFSGQLLLPALLPQDMIPFPWLFPGPGRLHNLFTALYLAIAAVILLFRLRSLASLRKGFSSVCE